MAKQKLIKKGFTLVEVVVALGILAMVFAGTVTLIVKVSSLGLASRDRTTAVGLAQGKMDEVIANYQKTCAAGSTINSISNTNFNSPYNRFAYNLVNNINFSPYGTPPYQITDNDFQGVTITVSWQNMFGQNSYTLKRFVPKCQ